MKGEKYWFIYYLGEQSRLERVPRHYVFKSADGKPVLVCKSGELEEILEDIGQSHMIRTESKTESEMSDEEKKMIKNFHRRRRRYNPK